MSDDNLDYEELSSGGQSVKRGPDGQFLEVTLTPERAAFLNAQRGVKSGKETQSTLLQEAGYANPDDAPEHLRLLAGIAASRRSGSVAAMRDFLRLTSRYFDSPTLEQPIVDGVCPRCHQWVGRFTLSADVALELGKMLAARASVSADARAPEKNRD